MIEIKSLTKNYSIDGQFFKAVDNVSLSVKKGEMVSIIGHSGSGKTTLLSLIGGLTRPDAGQVLIDNIDIWSMKRPLHVQKQEDQFYISVCQPDPDPVSPG